MKKIFGIIALLRLVIAYGLIGIWVYFSTDSINKFFHVFSWSLVSFVLLLFFFNEIVIFKDNRFKCFYFNFFKRKVDVSIIDIEKVVVKYSFGVRLTIHTIVVFLKSKKKITINIADKTTVKRIQKAFAELGVPIEVEGIEPGK